MREACGPGTARQNDLGLDRAADQFHFWNPSERNAFVGKKSATSGACATERQFQIAGLQYERLRSHAFASLYRQTCEQARW